MALFEQTILDQIEIKANGTIFVKHLNQIIKDETVISSIPHRTCYEIGQDGYEEAKQIALGLLEVK